MIDLIAKIAEYNNSVKKFSIGWIIFRILSNLNKCYPINVYIIWKYWKPWKEESLFKIEDLNANFIKHIF